MIALKEFLELSGLVTLKELIDFYGPEFDSTEFNRMITDREVSVHTEAMGRKNYRYPFYDPFKLRSGEKGDKIMDLVVANPGINASTIRSTLKISQGKFERWETEKLAAELIVKIKKGRAWVYSIAEAKESSVESSVECGSPEAYDLYTYYVRDGYGYDASINELAKDMGRSREIVKKSRDWLIGNGLLTVNGVNFPKENTKEFLLKFFPKYSSYIDALVRLMETRISERATKVYTSTMVDDAEKLVRAEGENGLRFEDLKKELKKGRWTVEDVEDLGPALQRLGAQFFKVDDSDELWVYIE